MSHLHEKIDFTVEVFVVSGDAVLLRKHDKYKIWLGVGGHIELDEEPTQAAVRDEYPPHQRYARACLADLLRTVDDARYRRECQRKIFRNKVVYQGRTR
jgi:hypothetical protein